MKLPPGTALSIGLVLDEAQPSQALGRLAMADGIAQLEWSPTAIEAGRLIAPLLYPLEPGLIAARTRSFDGLHGFIADSLPDGWGKLLMTRRLAKLGHSMASLSELDRLALVGKTGRGALIYEPATLPPASIDALDLDALASQSLVLLKGNESDLADTLAGLGGASGGARPKVHVGFSADGRTCVADGEVEAGFESWIVKFPALNDPADIGPVEEAYARMARAAGVEMTETRLVPAKNGYGYFATRRFDRPSPGRRLHMVSLAGAAEAPPHLPSLDYDGFLRATLAIARNVGDVEQAFRRMIFNILAHNRDDHTAQHSYLMDESGEWRLAPAYDLTFSEGPGGEHYMSIENEGSRPTRAHVDSMAKRHGLSPKAIDRIVDEVRSAIGAWRGYAAAVGVGPSEKLIEDRLSAVDRIFTA